MGGLVAKNLIADNCLVHMNTLVVYSYELVGGLKIEINEFYIFISSYALGRELMLSSVCPDGCPDVKLYLLLQFLSYDLLLLE